MNPEHSCQNLEKETDCLWDEVIRSLDHNSQRIQNFSYLELRFTLLPARLTLAWATFSRCASHRIEPVVTNGWDWSWKNSNEVKTNKIFLSICL